MTGVRRGQWGSAVRAAVAVFVMMLALLALAAQATIAAPAAPPLPAPLATPPKSAAAPRRNTLGPASVMTYYVGTTADSSAASDCTTSTNIDCSLRQAVTLANANTGATNTINFAILGTGVQTITLATAIDITNPVVIDGYTQSGASANTAASGTNAVLKVRVDGNGGSLSGLVLAAGSGGSTVRGLSVTGFSSLANGAVVGIFIGSAGNVIAGDWLGVAPDGTTDGNYYGIGVLYSGVANTTIGGTALADRNLISGNNTGVALQGGSGNVIEGNLIGTNAAGTGALANSFGGVFIAYGHTSNNTVGGAGAGQANVIAFNGSYGVFIGTDAMDTTDVGITIRGNSIHDNGTAGIALNGGGANDHCDGDSGPNNFQNFPALSAAARAGGNTQISGTLDSTADHLFTLDFYASATNAGQGQTYLGSSNVITNSGCGASFSGISFPVVSGQPWITATATDVMTGDTSPFSAPLDTAVSIATTAGTPQSTPVTSTFATALKATVTDSTSAGVAGVAVTFTANVGTGGATGTFASSATVITDTNGVATAPPLTANGAAGAFTVTAAVNGLSGTATFNLTNSASACLVNSLMDPTEAGKTTLRGAVTTLNGGGCASDTVTFDPAVFPPATPQTIMLAGGSGTPTLMFTARPLTISGAGAGVIVDGNNAATVFTVDSGVTATLHALTIQHGSGSGLAGGGITNTGALTVTNSTFVGNNASIGAAIFTDGSAVAVANSTFSGNTASGGGGAIAIAAGTLTVTNGTIVGNGSAGGGQIREFGVVAITLTGTIIAEPVGNDLDVQGAAAGTNNLISDGTGMTGLTNGTGGNLVGTTAAPINPLLGVLGSYGGATQTIPLLPGSPAIDAGAAVGSGPAGNPVPSTDQRGKPRLGAPDIGAFESQGFTLTLAAAARRSPPPSAPPSPIPSPSASPRTTRSSRSQVVSSPSPRPPPAPPPPSRAIRPPSARAARRARRRPRTSWRAATPSRRAPVVRPPRPSR